ncbi:MAG: hypothetical protein HY060_07080 [Proteobacteria bacterium]|nr:hypothetical protein [Pseudomonadota bacterium]
MVERWAQPPHYTPPPPLAWLLALTLPVRLALLFAYWLYLGAAGVMAGLGVPGSLIGGALGLAVVVASYAAMVEARRREWRDEPRETLWRIVAGICAGLCAVMAALLVVLPAIVVLVLALWALVSVPVWLFRK